MSISISIAIGDGTETLSNHVVAHIFLVKFNVLPEKAVGGMHSIDTMEVIIEPCAIFAAQCLYPPNQMQSDHMTNWLDHMIYDLLHAL